VAAFGIGSFVGSFLGGKLSDRIGYRIVMTMSLVLGGIMFILLQFQLSFWNLYAFIALAALFGEAYRPAMMAAVSDFVPKSETGRTMAFLRLAINIGFSAGPALGGFIAAIYGYKLLFNIDGITCIFAGILFFILSKSWKKKVEERAQSDVANTNEAPFVPPYKNKSYLLLLLTTLLSGIAFVQWFHSIPVYIKQEWGFDERFIGLLYTINGVLIVLLEMPLVHILEKRGKIKITLIVGLVIMAASFLILLLPPAIIVGVLAMTLLTIGEILFLPLNNSTMLNMSPVNRRGEYIAYYSMTWSLTHILAPIFGLFLAETLSFRGLYLVLVIGLVLTAIISQVNYKNWVK